MKSNHGANKPMITAEREIEICRIRNRNNDETLHHVLTLKVAFNDGGRNWYSGQKTPKGYTFAFCKSQIQNGYKQLVIDGKQNPTTLLAPATRFSQKKLNEFAKLVQYPGEELSNHLTEAYTFCQKQWPDARFPNIESDEWGIMIPLHQ